MSDRRYFYQGSRLATVTHDTNSQRFLYWNQRPLIELGYTLEEQTFHLLKIGASHSVIEKHSPHSTQIFKYSPYGYSDEEPLAPAGLGFNGEYRDIETDLYHLGQGHRAFSTMLMRFLSPDDLSPFERGGLNAYCYCKGDPINLVDPLGTYPWNIKLNNALPYPPKPSQPLGAGANHGHTQRVKFVEQAGKTPWENAHNRQNALDFLRERHQRTPHLYENITQHLSAGDLHNAVNPEHGRTPNPSTVTWLNDLSDRALVDQHNAIITRGDTIDPFGDVRLSRKQVHLLIRASPSAMLRDSFDIRPPVVEARKIRDNLARGIRIWE